MMSRTARLAGLLALLCSTGCGDPGAVALPDLLVEREQAHLAFADPASCGECHARHVEEWEISNHAYAAVDPVFHAMVRIGQRQSEGKLGQFCIQCHSPIGLATGQTEVVQDPDTGIWSQPSDRLDDLARTGVSCDVCHSITDVLEPQNARLVLTPDGTRRGTIAEPMANQAHSSEFSELHASSDVCSSCHNVTSPKRALVEQTFREWEGSSFAAEGVGCQDCHMPPRYGSAAPGAPMRELHDHSFVGVDVSLLPPDDFPGYELLRERTATLLRSAAGLDVEQEGLGLRATVTNLAGHALPSGATAERQLWLEVLVWDSGGTVVYESGTLDANGDLRDGIDSHSLEPGTDPDLAYWGQALIAVPGLQAATEAEREVMVAAADAACRPFSEGIVAPSTGLSVVTFPWQADWQCDHMIPVDDSGQAAYDLIGLPPGEYTARVRLLFRSLPPYFLQELVAQGGLDPDVVERVPTVELAVRWLDFAR